MRRGGQLTWLGGATRSYGIALQGPVIGRSRRMKGYPILRACWYLANIFLAVSLGLVVFSAAWEFSMRSYLKGFSDAIIPFSDNPEQKVEAILAWFHPAPPRPGTPDPDGFEPL